jgi:Leucine-rich repeat (LRR) protein
MVRFLVFFFALFILSLDALSQINWQEMTEQEREAFRDSIKEMRQLERRREARERLERYQKMTMYDSLKEIDLTNMGLTEVPEFVFKASNLNVLRLDENSIEELPRELQELDSLRRIYWSDNQMEKRPKIPKLPQVERFYFNGSAAPVGRRFWIVGREEVKLPKLSRLPELEYLELKNLGLTRVPERFVRKNDSLRELVLNENPIVIDDKEISLPESLRVFKINKAGLTRVGSGLYSLTQLEELQLLENLLDSLPDGISRMSKLSKMSLYKNQLTTLPKDLFDLDNLTVIDLYYNQLEVIPASISKAKKLEVLYIAHNRIYDLPESIGQLKKLEKIYLQDNRLSVLPESIGTIDGLKVIRISKNYLTYFPDWLLKLEKLEEIDLNENEITSIPEEIAQLQNLKLFTYQDTGIDFQDPSNKDFLESVVEMMERGVVCKPTVSMEYKKSD